MISDTYHYEYKYDIAEAAYTEEQYNEKKLFPISSITLMNMIIL